MAILALTRSNSVVSPLQALSKNDSVDCRIVRSRYGLSDPDDFFNPRCVSTFDVASDLRGMKKARFEDDIDLTQNGKS